MDNLLNIRRIVLCLLRFDLWAADTIADELNIQQRLENFEYHFQRMWRGLPPVEIQVLEEWLQTPELYHSQPVSALREHVETFSENQLYSVIMNASTKPTYTRLLFKRIEKLVEQKAINGFATQHPDQAFEELQGLLLAQRPATRAEYIVTVAHKLHEAHLRLKAVVREARAFRECIKIAQEAGDLRFPPALQVLREKLEALNEHYEDAFRVLEEAMLERLMNTQISQFWDVGPQPPPHAVESYPAQLPSLNFMLFNFFFLASIPTWLCFYATPVGCGSPFDANFYQLLSSNVLQVLGTVTLLWPTVFHSRLSRMGWFWSWVLAGISFICVILNIVIYLVVSVRWSSIISVFGEASICIVSSMLVFRV